MTRLPSAPSAPSAGAVPASPERLVVGIDVAKTSFVAATWQPAQARGALVGTFANTPAGFAELAAHLQALLAERGAGGAGGADVRPHLVLEPTGGYELPLAYFAQEQGWALSLPNPAQVREWGRGLGGRAKTDRQDALLLARYGAHCQPPVWQPLAAELSELESLQRRKEDLQQLLRQERNRLQQLTTRPHTAPAVPASVQRVVAALEEELAGIEQAIADLLHQHTALQARRTQLLALPAVGPATVIPLLLLLARWDHRTGGQGDAAGLVAYAGLDPQPYRSGSSVHRHETISRKGPRPLRRQLFMGVLGGVRGHNPLRAFYHRLVDRGKAKKVALIAAMRKLVVWAWAVYRSGEPWDPAKLAHLMARV